MIIVKTPFRISLFGGGTDIPSFFRKEGGQVLGFAIKKYCYITIKKLPPFYDHNIRLAYSKIERCKRNSEISHPIMRAALEDFKIENIEIHYDSDLPGQSGVGSSSSCAVGLAHGLLAYKGNKITKEIIAKKAIYWERDYLKEKGGYQDQLFASYGGFNQIIFNKNGKYNVKKFPITKELYSELIQRSVLCYLPNKRFSHLTSVENYLNQEKTIENLIKIKNTVNIAIDLFKSSDINSIGELLDESWKYKREIPNVSNQFIDDVYSTAIKNGAIGGKLLGAGKGGFMFFICKKNAKKKLVKSLYPLITLDIDIDQHGSKLIYSNK